VIALLAALGLAALISLQPWATDSLSPRVSVAPDLGVALGDSVAVSPSRALAVAPSRPVAGGKPVVAVGDAAAGDGASPAELHVAQARPVAQPRPARPPAGSPKPASPEASPPPAAPVAVPVATPIPTSAPAPTPAPPTRVPSAGQPPGPGAAGPGPVGGPPGVFQVREGDERALSFSFFIQPTVYRAPGEENAVVLFRGEAGESPSAALQLWDDASGSQRGLWSSGDAMGGERFLAPVAEGVWHEAVFCFRASSEDDGFYLLILDGQPVDARAWVSLIAPGSSSASVETGLFRDGERVLGSPDILFGPSTLGETLEPAIP
jgi:hypothetical protein